MSESIRNEDILPDTELDKPNEGIMIDVVCCGCGKITGKVKGTEVGAKSHGYCPECLEKVMAKIDESNKKEGKI